MEEVKKEVLEDVLKYLVPHFKFLMSLILSKSRTELDLLKKRIEEGFERGVVELYPEDKSLNIDLKALEKEKGREWVNVLKNQLKFFTEINK